MNQKLSDLRDCHIHAIDGRFGSISDFYFDDESWRIHYIVVDTGNWLPGRKVLLSPGSLKRIDLKEREVHVGLTKQQVEDSPPIAADQPVSRQHAASVIVRDGWPVFWPGEAAFEAKRARGAATDAHLRSAGDITGHRVHAADGDFGHVTDFILDDNDWALRELVVAPDGWRPGKEARVGIDRIERVSWEEAAVYVTRSRDNARISPEAIAQPAPGATEDRTPRVPLHGQH